MSENVVIEKEEGIKMECTRCGRGNPQKIDTKTGKPEKPWFYKGKSDYYAPCPRCKTSVKVPGFEPKPKKKKEKKVK